MITVTIKDRNDKYNSFKECIISGDIEYHDGEIVDVIEDGNLTKAVLHERESLCGTNDGCDGCILRDIGNDDKCCTCTDQEGWFPCVSLRSRYLGVTVKFLSVETLLEDL